MPDSNRVQVRCMVIAVVALGLYVYSNTLAGEFVWDDASSVLLHRTVQEPMAVLRLFTEDQHAYAGGQGNFYRPLLAVTFMVDFWLSYSGPSISESPSVITELSPLLFHLDSIIWHCLASVFLLLLLRQFGAPAIVYGTVSLLYVVHPLHTEAVAYISGRADSMSATFMFAGLFCATRNAEGRRVWIWSGLTLACFVGGILSKESSFIFPGLLAVSYFVMNRIKNRKWLRRQWATLVGAGMILGAYALLRTGNGPLNFGSDSQPPTSTFGERIIETVQSFAFYVQLLFVPGNLHMERTLEQATSMTTVFGFVSLGICVFMVGYGFFGRHHRILFGSVWFLLTWIPISGLFPLNAPMAEHWMYVPMGGFLWVLMEVLFDAVGKRMPSTLQPGYRIALGVMICVWGMYLSMTSIERNLDWRNNKAIYEATLRENPKSSRVHYNLAVTYQDILKNSDGAKRHYNEVLAVHRDKKAVDPSMQGELWDEEIQSHYSLAQLYFDDQLYNEASTHFGVLSAMAPNDSNREIVGLSLYGLGQCFANSGDGASAQQLFAKAVEVLPSLASRIGSQR